MPRYTTIYCDFISRVAEVSLLRRKATIIEKSSRSLLNALEIRALCRASVVLLSSHIEAYIKELGEHTLDSAHRNAVSRTRLAPQFFYYVSKDKIQNIRSSDRPEIIARHVQAFIDNDAVFWQGTGPLHGPILSSDFNTGFSNPKFDKVKSYLSRFGYVNFHKDFMRVLEGRGAIVESALDALVDTRNAIAHGNPSATKTPNEVKEMEKTAKEFCRTVDQIFASWCKMVLCQIR